MSVAKAWKRDDMLWSSPWIRTILVLLRCELSSWKKKLHIPPSNSPVLLLGPVPASVMSKIKLFPCLDLFSPPTPTHFTVLHKHPGNTGNILWAIWSPTVSKTPILLFWVVLNRGLSCVFMLINKTAFNTTRLSADNQFAPCVGCLWI